MSRNTRGGNSQTSPSRILQQFALDVIGEAAFGIEIDAQSDAHTPLMTLIEGAVDQDFNQLAVFGRLPIWV